MGIYESNTVIFHGTTEESKKKIRGFLQDYNVLFKKYFGENKEDDTIYVGGVPTCGFELLDHEMDGFPADKGYYVVCVSPRWSKAQDWQNSIGFLSIFLEQKLCSKITWYRYWDQDCKNCIYMNDSQEISKWSSWKYFEFEPGKNGAPPECSDEDEDGEEFNQFVNGIMKGEREVEWKDGFPSEWRDECERLEEQMDRERNFDFDDEDFEDEEVDDEDDKSGKHISVRSRQAQSASIGTSTSEPSPKNPHSLAKSLFGCGRQPEKDDPAEVPQTQAPAEAQPSAGAQPSSIPDVCPNCGNKLKAGAKFCRACGTRVGEAAVSPELGTPGAPQPPSKDFSLIGTYIHWNILPEQIAVKIDENDIAAYGRDVKGVSIQDGVTALFFFNGKMTAQLGAGSYTFKDLGAEETRSSKPPKAESAPKDPKERKKAEKKGLFGSFINRVISVMPGRSRERARNAAAAGLTNRIPTNVPPVSIVLVRTTDFPLIFSVKNANTANLRSEIGLHTLCRVVDITAFYSRILSGDRKMVTLKEIGLELEPFVSKEINTLFATVSPDQVNYNTELQNGLLQRLQTAVPQVYPFISIVNIVNLTASNAELEELRRLREELYVSEQTLEHTMQRNVFLSRMEEARSEQDLRMRDIRNSHELSARQKDDAQGIALAQMDASLAAAKEKIYEEMSLTEDEKAKFNLMLAAQRKLREAKTSDEVEAAMQVFEKNGLLRQQEMDNLRHQITHDAKLRDLNDIQILSLATMQNQQELEQKKLEWERQNEEVQLDHELEQNRKKDSYRDERFRSELEMERMKREQELGLDQQEQLNQLDLLRQAQAIRQEREDAEHRRNFEMEKMRAQSQQEMTRIYTAMSAEQIMAANPNLTPQAAQALAEKFKAEAAAAQNDKSMLLMQQIMQMKQDHAQEMLNAKQQELERTRADANANSDRFVDGMKTTIGAVGGMVPQQPQMYANQMPPQSASPGAAPQQPAYGAAPHPKSEPAVAQKTFTPVCPKCNCPIEDGAFFCDNCGQRLS